MSSKGFTKMLPKISYLFYRIYMKLSSLRVPRKKPAAYFENK